jgi:hypothetical protein
MKFMRDWGLIMAPKERKELWVTRQKMEVYTFVEDIHNVVLQEEPEKLEMMVRRGEDCMAQGAIIHSDI